MDLVQQLQNGSDIRGYALDNGKNPITLTPQVVVAIGKGLVMHLKERFDMEAPRIAIGHDSRISARDMFNALACGVSAMGAEAVYTGLCSTPAMFMSTIMEKHNYDAAVMITASHLPFERNGFKAFTKNGGFEKEDIKSILTYAQTVVEQKMPTVCNCNSASIMDDYAKILRDVIIKNAGLGNMPLCGTHVIIDAGNGAGGFFEEKILQPLGADTTGSVFTQPDGYFPNHQPNPEDENAMNIFSKAVVNAKADLGIIFDTDVDRAAVVTNNGREINKNRLIALMCAILVQSHEGMYVVTDSVTSTGLAEFIEEKGAVHVRFKRGYRNVINEAIRLCNMGVDACLAIETSGHGAISENYFLDDGAYMAARIIAEFAKLKAQGKRIDDLIKTLREPAEVDAVRIDIDTPNFVEYGTDVLSTLANEIISWEGCSIVPNNYEGIRVNTDVEHGNGWFLLRKSLHDPVLPLNIESDSIGGVQLIRRKLYEFLSRYEHLKNY